MTVIADAFGAFADDEGYMGKLIVKNQLIGFRHCVTKKEREEVLNKKGMDLEFQKEKMTNEYWDKLNFTIL